MEEEKNQSAGLYHILAVGQLTVGLFLNGRALYRTIFFQSRPSKTISALRKRPILVAWMLLILPGCLTIFVYFWEHLIRAASSQELDLGIWCKMISFCSTAAIVTVTVSSCTLARAIFLVTQQSAERFQSVGGGKSGLWATLIWGNLFGWVAGFVVAALYWPYLGLYRGLYCCIKRETFGDSYHFMLCFSIFAVSLVLQAMWYFRSYQLVTKCEAEAQLGKQKSEASKKSTSSYHFLSGKSLLESLRRTHGEERPRAVPGRSTDPEPASKQAPPQHLSWLARPLSPARALPPLRRSRSAPTSPAPAPREPAAASSAASSLAASPLRRRPRPPTRRQRTSRQFFEKSLRLVAAFYVCWFPICLSAVLVRAGRTPPLWADAACALCAKACAIVHAVLALRALRASQEKRERPARNAPHPSGGPSGSSLGGSSRRVFSRSSSFLSSFLPSGGGGGGGRQGRYALPTPAGKGTRRRYMSDDPGLVRGRRPHTPSAAAGHTQPEAGDALGGGGRPLPLQEAPRFSHFGAPPAVRTAPVSSSGVGGDAGSSGGTGGTLSLNRTWGAAQQQEERRLSFFGSPGKKKRNQQGRNNNNASLLASRAIFVGEKPAPIQA
mmetsp:Transcript_15183/g.28446  ORF Transcript_15183/g.28446 Transcript_15183/m.28446 type:complete len:609 (-) Transcript_15183:161-1987(-)